jgi:hypothetical protein
MGCEIILSHRLHLLEVVEVQMLIVQNLPCRHVVYTQRVCNASGTGIRLLFFRVWRTAPVLTSTGMWTHANTSPIWETLLIEAASMSCISSDFPTDEKHLGVVYICVHVRLVHSQFRIATQIRKKLLIKLCLWSGTVSRDI